MSQETKIRTFLALPLAPSFEAEVVPLIEKLQHEYPEVKWVRPAQIHLTLHFFGSILPEVISSISKCVSPVASETKPLSLSLTEIGAFPDPRRPRVIWLGMGGEIEELKRLEISLQRELKKRGFETEERAFKPHLTLGRVKETRGFRGFKPIEFKPTEIKKIDSLILFQSHLGPEGATYEAIQTYPFSAS